MITRKALSPENALVRVAALCSKCEQAEYDIRLKLKSWGISQNDIDNIINRLLQEKYIDEQRYATAFTRDKFRFAGWGKIKIAFQLRMKHISPQAIENAINEIDDETYTQALERTLASKMRNLQDKEPIQIKASLFRFASSRGFEPELIYRMLPKITNVDDEF